MVEEPLFSSSSGGFCHKTRSLHALTAGIEPPFVRDEDNSPFLVSYTRADGQIDHISMSCFSGSKLCGKLFQSSAAIGTYHRLRTVHPLSWKGQLFPSLCREQAAPTTTFAIAATSQGGEVIV